MALFYFVTAIILEIITFVALDLGVLPENVFYDLVFLLMIAGLIFILPSPILQYIVSIILILLQIIVLNVNFSMYTFDGNFFSFDMLTLADEAMTAISDDYINKGFIFGIIFFFVAVAIAGFYIMRIQRKHKTPYKNVFISFVIMLLLVVQGIGVTINPSVLLIGKSETNQTLLNNTSLMKVGSFKLLGTFGFYFNNLMEFLSSSDQDKAKWKMENYFNFGKIYDENNSATFGLAKDENIIVVMLESLEWYGFSDGTFNSHTFSKELTPNIYNLMQKSIIATNFFSDTKTNVSESLGMLGGFPVGETLYDVVSANTQDYFEFGMPSILKEKGYETTYIHSFVKHYYSRNNTHKYLGFDNIKFGDDYEEDYIDWSHFIKDEEFLNYCLEDGIFIPTELDENGNRVYTGEKFYSFFTTLTTHGDYYGRVGNRDLLEYKPIVEQSQWYQNMMAENKYSSSDKKVKCITNYMATVVGLDKTIGLLVDKLKEYNIYDDTTIVLYSDHNTYMSHLTNMIKGVPYNTVFDVENNIVPFIIKSKRLTDLAEQCYENGTLNEIYLQEDENGNILEDGSRPFLSTDRYCSAYDIVPTLLDLLGIRFNRNIYLGDSLFTQIDDTIQVYKDESVSEIIDLDVRAYYSSSTTSFYGNFSMTSDLDNYIYDFPQNTQYSEYIKLIKQLTTDLLPKVSYMDALFNEGVYRDVTNRGDA